MKARSLAIALVAVAGAVAAGSATVIAAHAQSPGSSNDPNSDLLTQARERLADHDFSGVVIVQWSDTEGVTHGEQALVSYHAGVMEISDHGRVVASTPDRLLLDGSAWSTAPGAGLQGAPSPTDKYQLTRASGPKVAGQPTTVVDARRASDNVLVERFYIDDATGLVLRRESYDGGVRQRSLAFTSVWSNADQAGVAPLPDTASAPAAAVRLVTHLEAPYRAPSRVGNGFRLVGRWKHSGSTVQLTYSDGLLSASVFEQPGDLNWAALPAGGDQAEVRGKPAVTYSLPGGVALVWERGGVVYTCVGDAPRAELLGIAADVSRPAQDAAYTRLARVVLAPFHW